MKCPVVDPIMCSFESDEIEDIRYHLYQIHPSPQLAYTIIRLMKNAKKD